MKEGEDLTLLSVEFRDLVSAAMRPDLERLPSCLQRLIGFIDETPLLAHAVADSPAPPEAGAVDIQAIRENQGARLVPPEDRRCDLRWSFEAVQELAKLNPNQLRQLSLFYGRARTTQEGVSRLLDDTLGTLATCLRRVITAAQLKDEIGSGRSVEVRATHGGTAQVVVHQGEGHVSARLEASITESDVLEALEKLRHIAASGDLDETTANELMDITAATEDELKKDRPNRWTLSAISKKLTQLGAAYEAVKGPAHAIYTWISTYLGTPQVGP